MTANCSELKTNQKKVATTSTELMAEIILRRLTDRESERESKLRCEIDQTDDEGSGWRVQTLRFSHIGRALTRSFIMKLPRTFPQMDKLPNKHPFFPPLLCQPLPRPWFSSHRSLHRSAPLRLTAWRSGRFVRFLTCMSQFTASTASVTNVSKRLAQIDR